MQNKQNRRQFLRFLGRTGLVIGAGGILGNLVACGGEETPKPSPTIPKPKPSTSLIEGIQHSSQDELVLAKGLNQQVLISWNDPISEKDQFGFNNDYLAFVPLDKNDPTDGLLWVNHEYVHPLFVSDYNEATNDNKTKEQVEKEMYSLGGSIVRIQKNKQGQWKVIENDPYNRRITAQTPIPFNWDSPIAGATEGIGTFANCSGGITPWGTILTCEENYDYYYGERVYDQEGKSSIAVREDGYGWEKFYNRPPEHYGWVVEVDVKTGEAQKHIALGRCAHECATMFETPDGRLVVYTGDDSNDEHLYKFVGDKPRDLKSGTLYVANTEKGEWISLNYDDQAILQEKFKDQTEVLVRVREAAKLLGATPLNRPEDIEIDPLTGHVLIALTNNKPKGDLLGEILKIEEGSEDKTSTSFKASTFLAGGEATGFACPDNMAFDNKGNLWFTSDISGSSVGKEAYAPFGNNGLFLVPSFGSQKGEVIQIASAPMDAELTGPFFSPDSKELFLSVQHPGELSKSKEELTSHWPNGGETLPKPSVVVISGETLDKIQNLS
ncbi:MAG: DUF839 domain-containing protein [Saprospiraceae bacterium]|nr:DUF839 domain-containing protein [Saprospiraceae bacterium]